MKALEANGLCFGLKVTYGYWFRRAVVGKDLAVSSVSFARIVDLDRALSVLVFCFHGEFCLFFFSISCLLDRRVRACWKDAPEVQWIVQRGLPVFSVYCTRRLGFGYDKTAMF
jgi:hypothetical protein